MVKQSVIVYLWRPSVYVAAVRPFVLLLSFEPSDQWRKPGPQFGGTKKNFAVPQIQKFRGTARNSIFWN